MRWSCAAALLLLAAAARAGDWDEPAALAGVSPSELGIRADRFPTPMTLPAVEAILNDPASAHATARAWGLRLSSATGLAGRFAFAAELLGGATAQAVPAAAPAFTCAGLPAALRQPVAALAAAVSQAQAAAARASSVYTDAERQRLFSSFAAVARHEPLASVDEQDAALAARFDAAGVAAAAARLASAVEAQLPRFLGPAPGWRGRLRCGATLVAGYGDDRYEPGDLQGVSLALDLGGDNDYADPAAAAGAGQAKVVIDLGAHSSYQAPAGSGSFGLGLFYAPTEGSKTFSGGDFSLGAGFFGAGGAWVAGPLTAKTGHFSQGAGEFGAGVFVVSGDSSALSADYAAQGYAATRGAGFLVSSGRGVSADCGLRHPDAREASLAALSLCQGAGDGPRAYAAGGVGLASFSGDGLTLRASYFAQGVGYWHAFGGLYVDGDDGFAQARRYVQGTGVHAGAGWLSWRGSRGRLVTWGVGPAFGWDYGVGLLELRGDDEALRADWGSGEGDVNGRSLALIEGNGDRLRLGDWGATSFKRAAAGYALARVEGRGNVLWSSGAPSESSGTIAVLSTPWGVTEGALALSPDVDAASATWPAYDRTADAAAEAAAARRALAEADELPPSERPAAWLRLAASGSLDGSLEAQAAQRVLTLPPESLGAVVAATTVAGFDQSLWSRLAVAAAGQAGARAAAYELQRSSGPRRALLADLLRYGDPSAALAAAETLAREPDWRLRRAAAGIVGAALGDEEGEEPGQLRLLALSEQLAVSTFTAGSPQEKALFDAIGAKRLPDLYGVLSLDPQLADDDKVALLMAGDPFDTVKPPVLDQYARALRSKAAFYQRAIAERLSLSQKLRGPARDLLLALAPDEDPDVCAGALAALGQVGGAADAAALGQALSDVSAVARDAAALGLARLGADGRAELVRRLAAPSLLQRREAVLAAAQSGDQDTAALARRGFLDADERVRLAAVGSLGAIQAPYRGALRSAAVADLRRLSVSDPSPSVRASAARVLGQIAPAPVSYNPKTR